MTLLQSGLAKSLAEDYTIDNSLRFDDGDTPYMSWTPSAANSVRTKWTISAWVKLGNFGGNRDVFSAGDGAGKEFVFGINSDNKIGVYNYTSGDNFRCTTDALLRDPSAWYHILCRYDSTDGTTNDRVQLFINGERQSLDTNTQPSSSFAADFWSYNGAHFISSYPLSRTNYYDGYLAEVYSIDGTAYTASDFGELNASTNQWIPKDASDLTFGTNGFYQKYGGTELATSFEDAVKYTVTSFTTVESTTWTAPAGVTSVEYLVVGGGGSGGSNRGGGGGAGGMRTGTLSVTPAASYTVTVGDGGGSAGWSIGNDGDDSIFSSITADGGGGGGFHVGGANNGASGGSGGGAGGSGSGGSATAGQGNDGGGGNSSSSGGGGGGAGGGGTAGSGTTGGGGGAGLASSITGSSVTYAGGGGGGTYTGGSGSGGAGGGGNGSNGSGAVGGTDGTGGGGGGGGHNNWTGAAGGSGIVVIRYFNVDGTVSGHTITANGDVTNTRAVRKIGDSSIYINNGASNNLSIPNSSDFDFGTGDFTMEMWVRTTSTASQYLMGQIRVDGTDECYIRIDATTNYFRIGIVGDSSGQSCISTSAIPINTWTHLAAVRDDETLRVYVNGVQEATTAFGTQSQTTPTVPYYIGTTAYTVTGSGGPGAGYDGYYGYMDEIRISNTCRYPDGTTFTPNPDGAFTADANTKLLIHSNWDGGLGADSSGNYNTFTPTNLVATDQMIDTPTNNWCTLSPLVKSYSSNPAFSEGNLKSTCTASGQWVAGGPGTFGVKSGKWYWEWYCNTLTAGNGGQIGIVGESDNRFWTAIQYSFQGSSQIAWEGVNAANKVNIDGADIAYSDDTYETGDVCGVALDMDSGTPTVTFYLNGVTRGAINLSESSLANETIFPSINSNYAVASVTFNFGQDSSFAGVLTAQGNQDSNEKGDFYYEPPADHLALCTDNLSDPEIALPGDNFNTVLYTGTNAADHDIDVGFEPGLSWFKYRGSNGHLLANIVSGAGEWLRSQDTHAEATNADTVTAFTSTGVTLGADDTTWNVNYYTGATQYASWHWKAGGAPTADNSAGAGATPTAGSVKIDGSNLGSALAGTIPATRLSANTTSGFSIVAYTGNYTVGATVAHGLSVAPELLIIKNLDTTDDWRVGSSKGIDFTDYLVLNTTAAFTDSDVWNDTTPSSSVFTLSNYGPNNGSGEDLIAYCFHSVEGYSKVGSYAGNSNADGTFVYCGFKPAYVLNKMIEPHTYGWVVEDSVRDPYNAAGYQLYPNTSGAEGANHPRVDFVSNGFKWRDGSYDINHSSGTYLFLAFAESPFKYSNAR